MGTMDTDVISAIENLSVEDVLSKHRRERKELQAKIQALKKNAPKSDKKKRKEVMEEVIRLETEIEKRHESEIKAAQEKTQMVKEDNTTLAAGDTNSNDIEEKDPPAQRVSKAQKRREKKEREARQREEEIRAAADDSENLPKAIEARALAIKLKERQLASHQILSDGDCLYNAIRHQLIHSGLGAYSVKELRNETANYIIAHKDSLICFMTHPRSGELLNDEEFEQYCEAVRSTPAWGGQIELKALSSVLKVPIEVIQAEGPPTVQGVDEFAGPNLIITYHRHMYKLGEHYNSTIPANGSPSETGGDDD